MMDQIAAKAQQVEQRLNSLGAGAHNAGMLQALGLQPAQIRAANADIDSLMGRLEGISKQRGLAQQAGLRPTSNLGALRQEAMGYQQLANFVGKTHPEYQKYIGLSREAAANANKVSSAVNGASGAFGHHARRIAEGIIIYQGLAMAVQGLQSVVGLVVNLDRESRRLEAALGLTAEGGREFVSSLGEIASQTVTPFADLVSEADTAAAAFQNVENAVEREASTLALLDAAGRVTTVTQRDMGTEVSNLIALMKQLNIPISELPDHLGKVVAAGGNTSAAIRDILDALQVSGKGAVQVGVDFESLTALIAEFRIESGRTGSEVGNTLKTLFQTITGERAEKAFSSVLGGLVQFRDAEGNIRPFLDLMYDVKALFDTGVIDGAAVKELFRDLAPPLNPGAIADLQILFDSLDALPGRVDTIANASESNLDDLVNKINDALGPQFEKLVIDLQRRFVDAFSGPVIEAGNGLLGVLRLLGEALLAIPAEVILTIVQFVALAAALKGVVIIVGGLATLFGVTMKTSMVAAAAQSKVLAIAFGGSMTMMRAAAAGFIMTLGRLLPLLAAIMAIDFAQQVGAQQEALKGNIGGKIEGMNAEELERFRGEVAGQSTQGDFFSDPLKAMFVDPALNDSLKFIDERLAALREAGPGATVAMEDLTGSFTPAADAAGELGDAISEQTTQLELSRQAAYARAEALANMTAEERNNLAAQQIGIELADTRAAAIAKLDNQLAQGNITLAEHTQGLQTVNEVSDLASKLTALYGDQLGAIPQLQGAVGEGTDAMSEALFNFILMGEGNIDSLLQQGTALLQFGLQHAAIADHVNNNPIIVKMAVQTLSDADLRANPELAAAQRFARDEAFGNPFATSMPSNIAAGLGAELERLLSSFGNSVGQAIDQQGKTSFGFGKDPKTTAREAPATPILDVGDLNASQVAQLIAIASRLRDQLPGEKARSADDVVALIKDAKFLQTVKGIDDRLLRIALEELTATEKERLELEKQKIANENVLKNLSTNVGPLGALISQPTAFGVGGNLALGQGLNVDPSAGNFTINVPIELQGLSPADLQAQIYATIAAAIRDALRSGA